MTHAHNAVIRGLNAIVQQAPHVSDATSEDYNEQDVKDLLSYVKSWTKMVNHHHHVEEAVIFPEIEKIPGCSGMTEDPRHQHDLFHPGMDRLLAYAESIKPSDYRWDGKDGMKEIIDSFAQPLTDHLSAEIDLFLGMKDVDSASLRRAWDYGEAVAKKTADIRMLVGHALFNARRVGLGERLTLVLSMIYFRAFWERLTRPTKVAIHFRRFHGFFLISSSTGSRQAMARGVSIPVTFGGVQGHSASLLKRSFGGKEDTRRF